jgi:hypothetical protein
MEVFLVYLWLKLNTVILWAVLFAIACALTAIISSGVIATNGNNECSAQHTIKKWQEEEAPAWKALRARFTKWGIGFFLFALFVPSAEQTAVLVGTSIAVDVAKSPEGTKIAALLRGKANELLDEELKKINPVKQGK